MVSLLHAYCVPFAEQESSHSCAEWGCSFSVRQGSVMSSELDLRYETGVNLQVVTHSCILNSISPKTETPDTSPGQAFWA